MPSDAKWCQKNTSATSCFSDQCTWSLDRLIWEKSNQHDLLSILSPPKHTLKVRQASLPPWEFNLPLYFVLCIQKICLGYSHDQNPCILHIHKHKHFQHKPQPKLSKALERFTSHLLLSFIQWREEIKGSRFSNDKKSNKRQCHIYVTRSMMSHKRQQACWHCYAIWWQKGWYNKKGEVKKRVMPQKKGNAAKWLMSQKRAMLKKGWHCKKRAKLQNGNFEKRVDATPGRQSLCCRAALKLLLFHIRSHFTKISTCSQSSCHPGCLCFVILITWRTQDASWWPRWGWRARRRWCRHWCQRPSEGSHSATSAPGLASHISLQRRIGFSIWLGDDNKYKVQVHRPDNR